MLIGVGCLLYLRGRLVFLMGEVDHVVAEMTAVKKKIYQPRRASRAA